MQLGSPSRRSTVRDALRETGRAQWPEFLAPGDASALRQFARAYDKWNLVTRINGQHQDLDSAAMARLSDAQRLDFLRAVEAGAERGFQYLYETFPIYDRFHAGTLRDLAPPLADLFDWINSPVFLDVMRDLLDAPDIGFADAQLTCYRAGHFLTTHDDGVEGKHRVAAFVLNLGDAWNAKWGGLLEFYDAHGQVTDRFVPRPNTLSMFKVPVPHAVTQVGHAVKASRYSVTGWLRRGEDPGQS